MVLSGMVFMVGYWRNSCCNLPVIKHEAAMVKDSLSVLSYFFYFLFFVGWLHLLMFLNYADWEEQFYNLTYLFPRVLSFPPLREKPRKKFTTSLQRYSSNLHDFWSTVLDSIQNSLIRPLVSWSTLQMSKVNSVVTVNLLLLFQLCLVLLLMSASISLK